MKIRLGELRRLIHEAIFEDNHFQPGDEILYGKWKNKRGKIVDMFVDDRGIPVIEIEPIPKGRKKNVTIGLYKIWKSPLEMR